MSSEGEGAEGGRALKAAVGSLLGDLGIDVDSVKREVMSKVESRLEIAKAFAKEHVAAIAVARRGAVPAGARPAAGSARSARSAGSAGSSGSSGSSGSEPGVRSTGRTKRGERRARGGWADDALRDDDPQVRLAAAEGLGGLEDPRAIEALSRALRSDESVEVRRMAAWALGEIEDARAVAGAVRSAAVGQG